MKLFEEQLTGMEAEFGASFPTGAKLAYSLDAGGFVVLDQHGNFLLNVSTNGSDTNYNFSLTNNTVATAATGKAVQTTIVGATNTVEALTENVADYSVNYADGKGNKFHFGGLLTIKLSATETESATTNSTIFKTVSIKISGPGGGTFFNTADGHYDTGVLTNASWIARG